MPSHLPSPLPCIAPQAKIESLFAAPPEPKPRKDKGKAEGAAGEEAAPKVRWGLLVWLVAQAGVPARLLAGLPRGILPKPKPGLSALIPCTAQILCLRFCIPPQKAKKRAAAPKKKKKQAESEPDTEEVCMHARLGASCCCCLVEGACCCCLCPQPGLAPHPAAGPAGPCVQEEGEEGPASEPEAAAAGEEETEGGSEGEAAEGEQPAKKPKQQD